MVAKATLYEELVKPVFAGEVLTLSVEFIVVPNEQPREAASLQQPARSECVLIAYIGGESVGFDVSLLREAKRLPGGGCDARLMAASL